ncbi:hypothetical protein [Burkholderia pseudomallei]|uniref:hypothetical protein n=1 Tax=Burkholderia pseudomallei TaxID=28450 RepID=UPI001F1634ED|nr:hypothetical protein [Burkholderia pseudomallei]
MPYAAVGRHRSDPAARSFNPRTLDQRDAFARRIVARNALTPRTAWLGPTGRALIAFRREARRRCDRRSFNTASPVAGDGRQAHHRPTLRCSRAARRRDRPALARFPSLAGIAHSRPRGASCHPRERRAFDPRNGGSMPQPECAPP